MAPSVSRSRKFKLTDYRRLFSSSPACSTIAAHSREAQLTRSAEEGEKRMKKLWSLFFLAVPALVSMSQDTAPDGFKLWNGAALAPIVQSLGTKAAADSHHTATERLGDFDHEYFLLAHRDADGQAEWHET